jgi:hypothetical protein
MTESGSGGGGGTCPHDNRNGKKHGVEKTKPKCDKDPKEPKVHKNK